MNIGYCSRTLKIVQTLGNIKKMLSCKVQVPLQQEGDKSPSVELIANSS